MPTALELIKMKQKAENQKLLQSFNLPQTVAAIVAASKPAAPKLPRIKKPRVEVAPSPVGDASTASVGASGGRRTSRRLSSKLEQDAEQAKKDAEELVELDSDGYASDGEGGKRQRAAKSLNIKDRPSPKIFGHQPGVKVGTTWGFRMGCSQAGIHGPVVAGISGNEHVGCWSVALSGGYEDDIDLGYAFTFTGSGGRDLKGTAAAPKNLRTAPQSSDQEFTKVNAGLQKSVKTQKPVRVVRGFKGQSCFAPLEGYRYDGLYRVTKAWRDVGESGFLVCRYAFVRLDGQPDIPIQQGREAEADEILKQFGKQSTASPTKKKGLQFQEALETNRGDGKENEDNGEAESADNDDGQKEESE